MTTLAISAKNLSPNVNYKRFDEIKLNNPLFTIESIQEEVRNLKTPKEKKKAKKILYKTMLYTTSILTMIITHEFTSTSMALASTSLPTETEAIFTNTTPNPEGLNMPEITPSKITEWGFNLAVMALGGSMGIAMIMLVVTGIYSQFKRRKQASQWASDIIRGFVQSLIAIPLIYALFYLAVTLFQGFGFFNGIS